MQITVETKGNRKTLTIDLSQEDKLDKFGYGVLTNNTFESLATVFERRLNDRRALLYRDLPDNTVNDWLDSHIDEHALLTLLRSIADTVSTIGSFALFAENLLMKPDTVFVTEKGTARFIYVPLEEFRQDYTVLDLIREILECVEPRTELCAEYIRRIGMAYGQDDLDIFRIRDLLGQLENSVVVPAPAAASAPIPETTPAEMPNEPFPAGQSTWDGANPADPYAAVPPAYPAPGADAAPQPDAPSAQKSNMIDRFRFWIRGRKAAKPSGLAKPVNWDSWGQTPPAPDAMQDLRTVYQPEEDAPDFGAPGTPNASASYAQVPSYGQPSLYEQAASYEQATPAWQYEQNAPYGQTMPAGQYEQNAPYEQTTPAGQYEQNAPYEQTMPAGQYEQNAPYEQTMPAWQYEQNAPYGQTTPAGQYEQNAPYGQTTPWQAENEDRTPAAANPFYAGQQIDRSLFASDAPAAATPDRAWDADQDDYEKTVSKHPGSRAQMEQIARNNANLPLFLMTDADEEPDTAGEAGTTQTEIPQLTRRKTQETVLVDHDLFIIGKEQGYVDFFVRDNPHISRAHANIVHKDGRYYITDTNSTNHTYVNGQLCESNVETELKDGDIIRLANEDFTFTFKG